MLELYREFAVNEAAIPVIAGRKSLNETFAGADRTYTIEAMMGDAKALQSATSHNLGQNFAKAFSTQVSLGASSSVLSVDLFPLYLTYFPPNFPQFLTEKGSLQHVYQTSWGMSTRMVGGIIMTHGDDKGLLLPPRIAPVQVVIVPIWKKEGEREATLGAAEKVFSMLKAKGFRVKVDSSDQKTPGWKYNFYEMKVQYFNPLYPPLMALGFLSNDLVNFSFLE